jgi:cytochrome c5
VDNHENMSDGKTWALMAGFIFILIVIAVGISVTANLASSTVGYERSNADILRTEARIAPVGKTNLASNPNPDLGKIVVAAAVTEEFSAEGSYNTSCAACHSSGVMGAPKLGAPGDWTARLSAGKSAVYANAINGKGGMPARGGSSLDDDQVKAVVDYMLANSK